MDDPDKWFTELYDEHHRRVFAYALANAGRDIAEDVASETFLIAWRRLDDVPDTPLPWLLGVARNLMRQQRDGGNRRQALADRVVALTTQEDLSVSGRGRPRHPTRQRAGRHRRSPFPSVTSKCSTLVMWHGLAPRDAATVVGCSAAAFFVRLHRARRRLARAFDNAPPPSRSRTASLAAAPDQRFPGEVMKSTHESAFRALRPAALDRIGAEVHAGSREADLAAAFATPRTTPHATPARRRIAPRLLIAGLAAASVAAAAAVVVTVLRRRGPRRPAPHGHAEPAGRAYRPAGQCRVRGQGPGHLRPLLVHRRAHLVVRRPAPRKAAEDEDRASPPGRHQAAVRGFRLHRSGVVDRPRRERPQPDHHRHRLPYHLSHTRRTRRSGRRPARPSSSRPRSAR